MTKFDNFQLVNTYMGKYMTKYSPVKKQCIFTTIITDQGKATMHFPLVDYHNHVTFRVFGEKHHHVRDHMYDYYDALYELFLDSDLPLDKIWESLNAEVKRLYGEYDIEHSPSIHDFRGFDIKRIAAARKYSRDLRFSILFLSGLEERIFQSYTIPQD